MAYGAGFRTLVDLTFGSLAEAVVSFGASVELEPICRKQLHSWRHPPLYDDSRPFLDAVKVPVCLVSDVDQDDLTAVPRRHGVAVAVTSEEARAYKPRPEPFQLALARLGLGPDDVVHIGTSTSSDVAGAAALGIDAAFLDRAGGGLPPGGTATYTAATPTPTALPPQVLPW